MSEYDPYSRRDEYDNDGGCLLLLIIMIICYIAAT